MKYTSPSKIIGSATNAMDHGARDITPDVASNWQAFDVDECQRRSARRRKRRRVVIDDEECDDDDDEGVSVDKTAKTVDSDEIRTRVRASKTLSPNQLVHLSVKTAGSTFLRFAVHENLIRQIPDYSRKLDTAIAQSPNARRARITDHKIRREETFVQAIEYLSDGLLEPLDAEDEQNCYQTLVDLVYLYDIGVSLSIDTLQHAIVHHITACEDLDPETFVDFATECYREGKDGHKITPDCPLGQFIKTTLADRLPFLVESDLVDRIREIGGVLNKQLVDVFKEYYQVSQSAKKSQFKVVKVELDD